MCKWIKKENCRRVSRWYREVKIATNVRFLSLVRVTMKHHNQKQVGEERVYLAYTSILLFSPEGSQDRKSYRAGTWGRSWYRGRGGVLFTDLLIMACSACFLTEPRTTSPGMAPPAMGWTLPHQSLIKKMPYRPAYILILRRRIPNWDSLLSDDFGCLQLT